MSNQKGRNDSCKLASLIHRIPLSYLQKQREFGSPLAIHQKQNSKRSTTFLLTSPCIQRSVSWLFFASITQKTRASISLVSMSCQKGALFNCTIFVSYGLKYTV